MNLLVDMRGKPLEASPCLNRWIGDRWNRPNWFKGISVILAGLALAPSAPSVLADETVPSKFVPDGYTLQFADEFDQASFDVDYDGGENWISGWKAWNVRALAGNSDDAFKMFDAESFNGMTGGIGDYLALEGKYGVRDGYLHEVSDGTLKIRAYPTPEKAREHLWGYSHVAGMLSSELSHAQQYGYFEVRARFNSFSKGMHFTFWTLAKEPKWPPEIDIIDVIYKEPLQFNSSHGGKAADYGPQIKDGYVNWYDPPDGDFFGWHVWSMEWTEDDIRIFIDGHQVYHEPNFVDEPMYFLASWEIGGNWPGDPDDTTVWPGEVEIDYVRIYSR
jgi:beta-glucanase (GH16 family)